MMIFQKPFPTSRTPKTCNLLTSTTVKISAASILVVICKIILLADCQTVVADASNQTASDIIKPHNSTILPGSNSSELLISGDEFVDSKEAPILLYDNVATTDNVTSSQEQNATLATVLSQPEANATTDSLTGNLSTTTLAPESRTTTEETEEEEDGAEGTGTDLQADDEPKSFNPPQNVSQYMDYIERLFHDLRHQITDLFEPHIPQLIRTSQMVQLSGACSYDMLRLALALRQFEPWALRMIDSSGKVPEGIFEGSFTALGSYDECLNTNFAVAASSTPLTASNEDQQVREQTQGKYCLVNVSPYLPPKPPADRVERMFQDEANRRNYKKDDQFSRLSPMFYYMKFRIGVCVPSTCVDSDLESISGALSTSLRLNITIPHCKINQTLPLTKQQLIGGFIFGLVLSIVLSSTLMDYTRRRMQKSVKRKFLVLGTQQSSKSCNIPVPIIDRSGASSDSNDSLSNLGGSKFTHRLENNWTWMSFSLLTNYRLHFKRPNHERQSMTARVFKSPIGKQYPDQNDSSSITTIKCLNGIRVLSLCWIIVANSYITLDPRATKRLTKTREAPKDFLFQMVVQASLAIETFFFLSGILMSLSFFRKIRPDRRDGQENEQQQQQKRSSGQLLKWAHFYIHRYIRMTPATMLVIAFTMFAFRYGDGPLWMETTHKAHLSCNENWWRHLLHIANFIDTRQMCFIHYWYISADMQLFLFAPILLLIVYKHRRIGYLLVSLIGLASIGNVFYTTYMRNLPPTLLFYNSDPESRREFGNTIMTKPLTHVLPYLVGMLIGKWLIKTSGPSTAMDEKSSQTLLQLNNNSLTNLFGLVALMVALGEVFLPYKWNNSNLPTKFLASVYAALFRLAWSLALGYLVISCRHRRGKKCARSDNSCTSCSQTVYRTHRKEDYYDNQSSQWCFCGSGGNMLNRLLSLNVFFQLSKLSFVAYLIHLPLMSVFIAQTRGLFAFSHTLVIHLALSYLLMTFILSFILVHIIEFPFLTLEKYIFKKLLYSRLAGGDKQESSSRESDNRTTTQHQLSTSNNFVGRISERL